MELLKKIWKKFLSQPDIWFFYAFLVTFTLSIRKVLWFSPINARFNEYSGIYLYLSDIFILLFLACFYLSKLYNKKYFLSIIKHLAVPRGTILLLSTFLLLAFISILWSPQTDVAVFRFFKILEFTLIAIYIVSHIVPRETIFKNSLRIIIALSIIQSLIGIWQFITQQSIGFFWLKESLIESSIPGVAKLIFNEEVIIRSYGLFPHPNILGGFLLFSIILTFLYEKLFHVEQLEQKNTLNCSTWNNSTCTSFSIKKFVPRGTILSNKPLIYKLILITQIIALLFSFSKSAIIGLIIAITYIHIKLLVPRGTKSVHILSTITKFAPRETFSIKKLLQGLSITIALILVTKPNIYSLFFKSLGERIFYLNVSRETIIDNPFFGLGIGQFVIKMQSYTNLQLSNWQFQPVHNIFLLIWSELGAIGVILFILILRKLFHVEQLEEKNNIHCSTWNNTTCEAYNPAANAPRHTHQQIGRISTHYKTISLFSRGLLLGIIFLMFFDHYFWTIQQGQIIFWVTIALLYHEKNS